MYNDPTFNSILEGVGDQEKTTGKRFEDMMTRLIQNFASNENTARAKKNDPKYIEVYAYDETEDHDNGTDIMFKDTSGYFGHDGIIRFDATHAFSRKNNMPFIKSEDEPLIIEGVTGDYEFHYGIRIGNPHSNFEEPVVVIGFDMEAKDYIRFEDDLKAGRNLAAGIYEIVNMSNDMLQSFYYQTDADFHETINTEYEEDERPNTELITFNKEYLVEAGRYASRKWVLPKDTKLAKASRELLKDMVYSPVLEKLDQKYEEQDLSNSITRIDKKDRGPKK